MKREERDKDYVKKTAYGLDYVDGLAELNESLRYVPASLIAVRDQGT